MIKLCFDYGHGGNDPGAMYKGRKEKEDTLKIGLAVAELLRRHGIEIDETRDTDIAKSLRERSNFENRKKYDYFISFHRNAFKPEKAAGIETYTYIHQTQKAKSMAERIQRRLVGIDFTDRGVKKANFHVLRETKAPAVLMEIGFVDHTKDNELFDSRFDQIVIAIAKAILEEVGVMYKFSNIPSSGGTLYRVMAGSYSKKENAQRQIEKLNSAGFDAVIMPYKA